MLLQTIKATPRKFAAAARLPLVVYARMSYHMAGLWELSGERPQIARRRIHDASEEDKQLSFTYALVAISSHVARADGTLTREKYVAFRDAFPLEGSMCLKLRKLFALSCDDPASLESHIALVRNVFPGRADLYSALITRLFAIATGGRTISREEEKMLSRISHLLGLPASDYMHIRSQYIGEGDAHRTLGVEKDSSTSTMKKRYRLLMQRYHPDRFGGQSLSPELELLLQAKTAEINAAYSQLTRKAA